MKFCKLLVFLIAVQLLTARFALAQQPPTQDTTQSGGGNAPDNDSNQNRPTPAARGLFLGVDTQPQDSSQIVPDRHVLSDSQLLGVGSLHGLHNVFDAAVHVTESADNGIVPGVLNSATSAGGTMNLDATWARYHLILFYNGGENVYEPSSEMDASYHNIVFSQEVRWRRWLWRIGDNLSVAPQAGLAGLDSGGPGLLGQVQIPTSLVAFTAPGQTILTGQVTRLEDNAYTDVDYEITRRMTITFSGSYGALHFLHSGYIDSNQYGGRVGLDYALDPKDSIAFIYQYAQAGFTGLGNQMQSHLAEVAFGRKITGRLAFQIAGGPEYISLSDFGPQSGGSLSWGAFAALAYNLQHTQFTLDYIHGLTAGSGVFRGSENHTVATTVSHNFSRNWSASLNAAYSFNKNLAPSAGQLAQANIGSAGANLTRLLGRYFSLSWAYEYQQQFGVVGSCPVTNCGVTAPRQVGTVAVNWHLQPVGEQ